MRKPTKKDVAKAQGICNDIVEGIDNGESRATLRRCLYALQHELESEFQLRIGLAQEVMMLGLKYSKKEVKDGQQDSC